MVFILLSWDFFIPALADGFHWSLSDSKTLQVSMTLLSILTELDNIVVWMASVRPRTCKSSSSFTKPLGVVPSAPITIDTTVNFMFHSFLVLWQDLSTFISLFASFGFQSEVCQDHIILFFESFFIPVLAGIWVIASLLNSPGLFPLFWQISPMIFFEWPLHALLFLSLPVPVQILWWFTERTSYNRYHCNFHVLWYFQFSSKVLAYMFLFVFFQFNPVLNRNGKVYYSTGSLFLLAITRSGRQIITRSGRQIIRLYLKIPENIYVSFSRTDLRLCLYHLFVWSNLNFLHNSRWITLPTQSCLVLYSFSTDLLHLFILWFIVLSQSPHNLPLQFCYVLSILALTLLVLMALFSAAIRKDSVSLLKFSFLSHVHVFSREIPPVSRLKYHKVAFFPFFFFLLFLFCSCLCCLFGFRWL